MTQLIIALSLARDAEVLTLAEELAEYLMPIAQMIKKYSSYIRAEYYPQKYSDNNDEISKPAMRHLW